MSASALGDFPPSSRVTGANFSAAILMENKWIENMERIEFGIEK